LSVKTLTEGSRANDAVEKLVEGLHIDDLNFIKSIDFTNKEATGSMQ